jgi:hypothetical protein
MTQWEGYKTVVELPEADGWVAREFNENWSDSWWPRRFITPLLNMFYELYPEAPGTGYGYTIVLDSGIGAFKVDALAETGTVRVTGPLQPQIVKEVREQHPELYMECDVIPLQ